MLMLLAVSPVRSQSVDEQYRQTIESADNYFKQADYLNAKASYQVASQLKPSEQYPKDRMKESISRLRVQMAQMANYNEKLDFADQLYEDQSYDKAIRAYNEALKLMPDQAYPASQIELIRNIKADEAQNQARYTGLIAEGDALFSGEDYDAARSKFEEAMYIYPDRPEAPEKIQAVDEQLAELVAQQSGYDKAISEAKMYHARKDYENELLSYQKAAELKPEEALPQISIRELNEFLRLYESYNKFVSEADELYVNQQFAEAKIKYEQALTVLPDESYPKEIISKINVALSAKTERDRAAYEEAIAKADELYNQEDYEAAMMTYSEALRFWPDGEHAKSRIESISEIRALQRAQEEAYNNLITHADKLFAEGDYPRAKGEYRKAADIQPFEQYPKVRIEEIDMILAELQSKLDQYEGIILGADKLFQAGDYEEARIQYLKAQEILSDRTYPEDQIKMIDEILGLVKATRDEYLAAIARGDEHFANREWEDAKVDYVTANDLIPEEQYPDDKIAEINEILARLKAAQEMYTLALKNADQLFADKDYNGALIEYRKAADIFSNEEYPKQQIETIHGILAGIEAQRTLDEQYENSITKADEHFNNAEYTQARAAYEIAKELKTEEPYPVTKITEIDAILEEQSRLQSIEENYAATIATAENYFINKQYAEAKAEFTRAGEIKAEETYPEEKIAEIDEILAELARLEAIDNAYTQAISTADDFFDNKNYAEARTAYQHAIDIKTDESYPVNKIAEIDALLAEAAEEAEMLAQLEADYSRAITEADAFLSQGDHEHAREKFVLAQSLKPAESYPKDKITEIDGVLAGIEAQRVLDEDYSDAIAAADKYFNKEDYTLARAEYEKASQLKAEEQYPADKITEIDAIFAEQARLNGIESSYAEAITAADNYFSTKQYAEAKAEYARAGEIKAGESYPSEKISEIDGILAELARLQSIEEAYASAIANAEQLLDEKNYTMARTAYMEAADIKPDESLPREKISEIDAIVAEQDRLEALDEQYDIALNTALNHFNEEQYEQARDAYQRAASLKPEETYPAERIEAINNILANIEEQRRIEDGYATAITRGENHLTNNEYTQALAEFEKALGFKENEQYPLQKITEINEIFNEQARVKELDAAYDAAITNADALLSKQEYNEAKMAYEKALEIKPADPYTTAKLNEIDAILVEILAEQARQEAIEEEYQGTITNADALFDRGEYEQAKARYSEAMQIKTDNTEYPLQKITEIDQIMAEIARNKALDEKYAMEISQADEFMNKHAYLEALQAYKNASETKAGEEYPREKIAEINSRLSELKEERDKAYNAAIAQADSYFNIGNYRSAKSTYQTAVDIKPDEQYARDRLDEVTKLYRAELEILKIDYQKYVADADNYFNSKIYDGAIENYRLAAAVMPDEEYPGKMISRITKIINDNAITDVNKLALIIPNNTEHKFPFTSLPVSVRKENYILIKAKNLSNREFKMLVNFGQDNTKMGGVVLQVPDSETVKDYIVRIGALYKWFSEDINWLSIYPEGGDIEIALIRISKSD